MRKKQKNTIFIVVDSVYYDRLTNNEYKNTAMPFLQSLSKKGLSTEKMYSEAPYTEAALVSLLAGKDTLKSGGYIKKMDNKTTIMEVFQENGYDTFFNGVQPHVYPGKAYPGITDEYYNVCFNIFSLWDYRFKFYSDLYLNNALDDKYYPLLQNILNDNFREWIKFFKRVKGNDKSIELIAPCVDFSGIEDELEKLENEYKEYKKNPQSYLIRLLKIGTEHEIFKIKNYEVKDNTSIGFRKKIYKKYGKLVNKIGFLNLKYNLFNNKPYITFKKNNKNIQMLKVYKNCILDKDLYDKINPKNDQKKLSPSMYTHIKHFIKWQEKRKTDSPYFAYIHIDDCHYPEIFYSYDIEDEEQLDKEFSSIKEFIKELPRKYRGSLAYDLSLLYADNCIKYLYKYLEANNLLDNTNIAICADHGSSYTFDPMHENYVVNQYKENYNIPFVLVGNDIEQKQIKKYCNSKDIPATIIDAANLKVPKNFDGHSLLRYEGNNYAILQNVNGGCPDYNIRKVLLGVKDDNYSVTMEFDMTKDFEDGSLYSVFDMKNDCKEHNNLKDEKKNEIEEELSQIRMIFEDLKKDIEDNNFLNNN